MPQIINQYAKRRERKRLGISARQQRKRDKAARRAAKAAGKR